MQLTKKSALILQMIVQFQEIFLEKFQILKSRNINKRNYRYI